MQLAVENLYTMAGLAAPSGIAPRTIRHWLSTNKAGFRDRCSFKVDGRIFLDREAVAVWVEEWRGYGKNVREMPSRSKNDTNPVAEATRPHVHQPYW